MKMPMPAIARTRTGILMLLAGFLASPVLFADIPLWVWAYYHYHHLGGEAWAQRDWLGDDDSDGYTNLEEAAGGTDPASAASFPDFTLKDGQDYDRFQKTFQWKLEWFGEVGIEYDLVQHTYDGNPTWNGIWLGSEVVDTFYGTGHVITYTQYYDEFLDFELVARHAWQLGEVYSEHEKHLLSTLSPPMTEAEFDQMMVGFLGPEGHGNLVQGWGSSAFGFFNFITGEGSFASGFANTISADYASAFGSGLIVEDQNSMVIGRYNAVDSSGDPDLDRPLLIIGNGEDEVSRSNALIVRESGNMELDGGITLYGTSGTSRSIKTAPYKGLPNSEKVDLTIAAGTSLSSGGDLILKSGEGYTPGDIILEPAEAPMEWHPAPGSVIINGGYHAFASGSVYLASERGGVAIGDLSIAEGHGSVAAGIGSQASGGGGSAAFGSGVEAVGYSSFAAGYGAMASGSFGSISLGYETYANGSASHSVGGGAVALGYSSSAWGAGAIAAGNGALASGYGAVALGASSATANGAFAVGSGNQATGIGSVATGSNSQAKGIYAAAHGEDLIAEYTNAFVVGLNNDALIGEFLENRPLFIVGNGADSDSRSNALVVRANGDVHIDEGELHAKVPAKGGISMGVFTAD